VIAATAVEQRLVERRPILAEFRRGTSQVRGLRHSSIEVYLGVIAELIAKLGGDAGRYTAGSLRAFVLDRAKPHGIWRAKSITTSVRAYLRFLAATGRCPTTLADAIRAMPAGSSPAPHDSSSPPMLRGCSPRAIWERGPEGATTP
jgi:hypothetical protein